MPPQENKELIKQLEIWSRPYCPTSRSYMLEMTLHLSLSTSF